MIKLNSGISYKMERNNTLIILRRKKELVIVSPYEGLLYYYPLADEVRGLSQEKFSKMLMPIVPKVYRLLFEGEL